MGEAETLKRALTDGAPAGQVPLWELHFHLWGKLGYGAFVSGADYLRLSEREQHLALERDAEIIVRAAHEMGMAGVSIPDPPWDCIYTLPQPARLELVRALKKRRPDFLILGSSGATIAMPGDAAAFMELCYALMDDPDGLDARSKQIYERGLAALAELAEAGIDCVYCASDMADNRGPFFSPAQLERYIWPYLAGWTRRAHELGLKAILHTDGNVQPLLGQIVACGLDGLQALDPISGMTLAAARAAVGDALALCGNLDCSLMLAGTPEQIYENALSLLAADGQSGRMVLGCSNAVTVDTPPENYRALLEAHKDYRRASEAN